MYTFQITSSIGRILELGGKSVPLFRSKTSLFYPILKAVIYFTAHMCTGIILFIYKLRLHYIDIYLPVFF